MILYYILSYYVILYYIILYYIKIIYIMLGDIIGGLAEGTIRNRGEDPEPFIRA